MKEKQQPILEIFKPFLWSFDIKKMELEKDKKQIITNVLNFGTKEATDLLFEVYKRQEIKQQVENPLSGEWSDKSLNYWSLILGVNFKNTKNVLRHLR